MDDNERTMNCDDRRIGKAHERIRVDKILQDLSRKVSEFYAQIDARHKELRKIEGLVVDSVSNLRCEKHPDARYEVLREIKDSGGLKVYMCSACNSEFRATAIKYEDTSKAHDCPRCNGVVIGDVLAMPPQGYQFGEEYYCNMCSEQLGSQYPNGDPSG